MAGHSKWANIQHRKGRQDKKRGKLFTKLIREITVAARIGGAEVSSNPRLRAAIDNAKSQSMPTAKPNAKQNAKPSQPPSQRPSHGLGILFTHTFFFSVVTA